MAELEPFSESCDDFERALLRSTRRDAPAAGAATKTLLALGLVPTSAAAAAGGVSSSAAAGHSLAAWSILKGLAVGLLAGGGIVLVSDLAQDSARPPRDRAPMSLSSSAGTRGVSAVAPPVVHAADQELPSPVVSPSAARRFDSKAAASANLPSNPDFAPLPRGEAAFPAPSGLEPTSERRANEDSLGEQVTVIDSARRALKSGRPSDALGYARNYDQRWPSGPLSIEAVIVRVEAELALGDRPSAEREARSVIAQLPGSRYASRVRRLFVPPLSE